MGLFHLWVHAHTAGEERSNPQRQRHGLTVGLQSTQCTHVCGAHIRECLHTGPTDAAQASAHICLWWHTGDVVCLLPAKGQQASTAHIATVWRRVFGSPQQLPCLCVEHLLQQAAALRHPATPSTCLYRLCSPGCSGLSSSVDCVSGPSMGSSSRYLTYGRRARGL